MKATIQSTSRIVEVGSAATGFVPGRVWEGVSEDGVPFFAVITRVAVHRDADNSRFEAELQEHTPPSVEQLIAIPLRMVI